MKMRTWRDGSRFYKSVGGPAEAENLILRATAIARAGGNTPVPSYCPDRNAVSFPVVDGTSGMALVDELALTDLLSPLQAIRRAEIAELPIFEPFAKITPRLGTKAPQWLITRIVKLLDRPLEPGGVVHGDFHCGQMIRDVSDRLWVIDLDDMAQGPIEADLGNLAAHLATRPETGCRNLAQDLLFWSAEVQDAWTELGETCDPHLFLRHVDIAVTRRAMKLHDVRGETEVLDRLEHLPLLSR